MQAIPWVRDNLCPVLLLRNTGVGRKWHVGITTLALACLVGGVAGLPRMTQAAQPRAVEPQEITAPLVDRSHAARVYSLIEQWVRDGRVPGAEVELPPINVSGVEGMRITLRWGGERTMGIGEVYGSAVGRRGDAVDLVALSRVATQRALDEVMLRARDSMRLAREAGRPADLPELYRRALNGLLIDMQIALPAERMRVPITDPDAAMQMFSSGYHGLLIHLPDQPLAGIVWPASALASNVTPHGQLLQLLAQAQLRPEDAKKIGQPNGPSLSRFRVLHMVRPAPDQPVMVLTRGNIVLGPNDFDLPTLNAMAERLSNNLARRLDAIGPVRAVDDPPDDMKGTFMPTMGLYDPELANTEELALTAYVLARRARLLGMLEPQSNAQTTTVEAGRTAMRQLEQTLLKKQFDVSPHAAALTMMSIIEAPYLADRKPLRDRLAAKLMRLQNDDGTFRLSQAADSRLLNTAAQSLMFAAAATLYEQTRDRTVGEMAALAQAAAWRMVAEDQNLSALPWLMIGEAKLRTLQENLPAVPDALSRDDRLNIVRQLAQFAFERQIIVAPDPAIAPEDVLGGFDFSEALNVPGGAAPAPDWRTAEVLAFLANAMTEPGLVEEKDLTTWVLRSSLAGRYIAQLMMDEPSCFYVPSRRDAIGAVRQSLHDNSLTVSATALSLLAATELQQTYYQLTQSQRAKR